MRTKIASFYNKFVDKWLEDKNSNILIVGGSDNDYEVFNKLGFKNVTISNLDERVVGDEFKPFKWSYQDGENLSFPDNSFDFVVVHAALHHCHSPHRALLEMYRVAKHGIILFEARDSLLMKLMEWLGLAHTYEHDAVFSNNCQHGGVSNSDIPNFIYRWTEREIAKTINSYAPFAPHCFSYAYGYDIYIPEQSDLKGLCKKYFAKTVGLIYPLFALLFPKQQNLFACFIRKPDLEKDHFKWLEYKAGKLSFNQAWAEKYYNRSTR